MVFNEIRFIRRIEEWIKHYNIFVSITYSMHDLLSDLNNHALPANRDMRQIR